MNNKGQSLVLFICLLPLLVILFTFIFDSAYIIRENNRLNNIASLAIDYIVSDKKDIEEVKKYILTNDSSIKIINLSSDNVHLKNDIEPIFGKIVGYDKYSLEVNLKGYINENDKLIITEEG